MRLAVITNAYPPAAQGGAGVIAAELVELWRASGHDVRVWDRRAAWLKKSPIWRLFGHLWQDLGPSTDLADVLAWQPDLVITHNLTGVGWGTGKAVRAAGISWIHVLHDVQLFEPSGQIRTDQVTRWQCFWAGWRSRALGRPTRVVSPTAWLLEAHARRGLSFSEASVIPNPAPEVAESSTPERTPWIFVGRLSEDKGADFLCLLAHAHPEDTFLCVGDGPLRAQLACLPNVRCVGALARSEVQAALLEARGLLMPSRLQENQPTVLLEAFSAGIPVIASSQGGIPETVGAGGIVAELTLPAWARALEEVAAQPFVWRERSRLRAKAFSRDTVRARWEVLLSETTEPSSG